MIINLRSVTPKIHRPVCPSLTLLLAATSGLTTLLASTVALAAISVTSGPVNPPYPGANPDPWNAGVSLDLDESTLIIDDGSQVTASTLFIDGRTLVSSNGLLDIDTTTLLTGPGGSASGAAFHLDGGNVNAGTFSGEDGVVLYIGVDNNGIFTTDSAGGIGANTTTTISLDSGGQLLGTGNTSFGGASSSFSLGPSPLDPTAFTGELSSVTALVTLAKAGIADTAMDSITQVIGGSNLAGVGDNTNFQITGDLNLGGTLSDALLHVNDDSVFDVTGAFTVLGGQSILTLVVVDSEFNVGGDTNIAGGDLTSTTIFLDDSQFEVGGNLATAASATSNMTITANSSPMTIAGFANLQIGSASAFEISLSDTPVDVGGDFLMGNAVGGDSSAFTITALNSDLEINGNMQLSIGNESVMSGDFEGGVINTTGDFRYSNAGDSSTILLGIDGTDFTTGGSLILESIGEANSATFTFTDSIVDITSDFTVIGTGAIADRQMQIVNLSGDIGRDFSFLSGISQSTNAHVMAGLNLNIGRDLSFLYTQTSDPGIQLGLFLSTSTLAITRNLILGSLVPALITNSSISVGNSMLISGDLRTDNLTVTGDVSIEPGGSLRMEIPTAGTPGQSLNVTGDLNFSGGSTVILMLAGTEPNTVFQPITHSGSNPVVLSGDLQLEFPDGMPSSALSGQAIPLISSNMPIVGSFANVMVGGLVPTGTGQSSYFLLASESGDTLFLQTAPASIPVMSPYGLALLLSLILGSAGMSMRINSAKSRTSSPRPR